MSTIKPKIQGKFYALQNDEWTKLTQMLTHSELIVLYHLRTIDPFGDRFQDTSTKSIAETLKISQRTVQRAILKLSTLQLIEIELGNFRFRVRSKNEAIYPEVDINDDHIGIASAADSTGVVMATPMSRSCHPRRDSDTHVASTSLVSSPVTETLNEQEFEISHTFKIQKDLKDSLSTGSQKNNFTNKQITRVIENIQPPEKAEQLLKPQKKVSQPQKYQNFKNSASEEEIQKFKDFCYHKSLSLSTAVVLMEKWIGSNFDELYEFYLAAGRRYVPSAIVQKVQKNYEDHPGIIAGLADGRILKLDSEYREIPSLWATMEQGAWQSQEEWLKRNGYL
jgi:hypothetical protein